MLNHLKNHKGLSIVAAGIVASIIYMMATNTLSYPYILISRQIQMITYCVNGTNEFKATTFGFDITAPEGYCFLPHRIFPDDGSVQVLKKGWYSVISEYAYGTVIGNSKATLLFEPITADRNKGAVFNALSQGGFLENAQLTEKINKNNIHIYIARNVLGVDKTKHFDWAFITHPNGKIFLSILLMNVDDPSIFDYVINNIKTL